MYQHPLSDIGHSLAMLCKLASNRSQPKLCQLICTYTHTFVFTEHMWYPNLRMVYARLSQIGIRELLYHTITLSNLLTPNMQLCLPVHCSQSVRGIIIRCTHGSIQIAGNPSITQSSRIWSIWLDHAPIRTHYNPVLKPCEVETVAILCLSWPHKQYRQSWPCVYIYYRLHHVGRQWFCPCYVMTSTSWSLWHGLPQAAFTGFIMAADTVEESCSSLKRYLLCCRNYSSRKFAVHCLLCMYVGTCVCPETLSCRCACKHCSLPCLPVDVLQGDNVCVGW